MTAVEMAAQINAMLPKVKAGTLRFWGEWFGRPHDNWHQVVRCFANEDRVTLEFNEGESLTIWQPQGLEVGPDVLSFRSAVRVRWQWHYYGRPKTPQNLYFEEFVHEGSKISTTTNINWYSPVFHPSMKEKAVEVL